MSFLPPTEFSNDFVAKMQNRMAVSFHKYGPVAEAYPRKIDALKSLRDRLRKYEETGNTEWLVDAANFAMIEFMHPGHESAHFQVQRDSGGVHRAESGSPRHARRPGSGSRSWASYPSRISCWAW